jgi:hypothetical protein
MRVREWPRRVVLCLPGSCLAWACCVAAGDRRWDAGRGLGCYLAAASSGGQGELTMQANAGVVSGAIVQPGVCWCCVAAGGGRSAAVWQAGCSSMAVVWRAGWRHVAVIRRAAAWQCGEAGRQLRGSCHAAARQAGAAMLPVAAAWQLFRRQVAALQLHCGGQRSTAGMPAGWWASELGQPALHPSWGCCQVAVSCACDNSGPPRGSRVHLLLR